MRSYCAGFPATVPAAPTGKVFAGESICCAWLITFG
jgi:hypothetical protein